MTGKGRRWWRRALAIAALSLLLLPLLFAAGVELAARLLPDPSLRRYHDVSQTVTDENGKLLRAFLTTDQKWRLAAAAKDLPPAYADMLLAYEDRRFQSHHGIDLLALARAAFQLAANGRVVSGGSTLTMQAARLLEPGQRGIGGKIRQLVAARQLERRYSKKAILAMYLTLAPFGGNIEGVRAASIIYFGKEPRELTPAEAALLIVLPQSPETRRPNLWPAKARAARNRALSRAAAVGVLGNAEAAHMAVEPMTVRRREMMVSAAHAAAAARRRLPGQPSIATLIDRGLQTAVETLARDTFQLEPARVSLAVLVVRNSDMAIRAYVSGPHYFGDANAGQLDLVTAIRSPGSALKPFVYGLAFETLTVHPLTIVVDAPVRFGSYEPKNFSEEYQGEVTVRDALIRSVNTTAVTVLSRIGPDRLIARLRRVGADLRIDETDNRAGLSIALGGCGISLADLTRLYAGLANGGEVRQLRLMPGDPLTARGSLLTSDAAWAVTDILADAIPPDGISPRTSADGGRRIAYKTGTSYSFRDAWAAGYDRDHTVAVWVGRPDGAPNPGASGRHSAAPLLFQIFDMLPVPDGDVAGETPDGVLAQRQDLPERLQRLSMVPFHSPVQPLKLAFPPDGARIIAVSGGREAAAIPMEAKGGQPPYLWFVDQTPVWPEPGLSAPGWIPPGKGQFQIRVIDARGASASAGIWVE